MSNIHNNLQKILHAVWGKDVRQAIHDAIHDCYEDGSAGATDLIAREEIEELEATKATRIELAEETADRLAEVAVERGRIDNLVTSGTGVTNATKRTETTLFSASVPCFGNVSGNSGYFNLEDAIDNYDYIKIRYNAFGRTGIVDCKPDDIASTGTLGSSVFHWSEIQPNWETTSLDNPRTVFRHMDFHASNISSGNTHRLSIDAFVFGWNGDATSNGKISDSFTISWDSSKSLFVASGFTGGIYSIIGVKYTDAGVDKDTELTDIRTGADGTVYQTAGGAVRGQIEDITNRLDGIESNFGDEYDSTATYAVGDRCVYGGVWYECNTAISTAEEWTAGHWDRVSVADITDQVTQNTADIAENASDIQDLKEDLNNKETNIFGLTVVDYIDGYYVDTGATNIDETPIASSGWSYAKFDCPPNYRVSIIGYGSSGGRLYCFFDANGNALEKASGTANTGGDGVMKTYVSPANTAYCIVNSSNRYANKYIVVSPLMDDVIHHKPSTLLTDTTATLESISEGFYRVSSGVASQLSWAPTTSTFNLLICSRSIYPAVTTERFAFAIDTYSRTFINVSGPAGYTGWHQILYVDSYPTTGTLSEYADAIVNSSGVLVPSAKAISTKDFVKDTVVGFQVTDSDIKVAVNRYTLTGEHVGKQYWYKSSNTLQDGKYHYKFDHATYKYRIYIFADDNETTIHDKPKLVSGVRLYESIDVIEHYTYHDADYDTFKKRYNFDNISTRLRLIQEANYQLSFANATDWMKLYSYYGDTQVVHPKVLYFPNMLFGHKYWMAYTPYPNANAKYENPCIAYSDDGYRFTNIEDNPIDEPVTDRDTSYYSDTHLVYREDTGKLECWYRLANELTMTETIYRMTSSDGLNWSDKEELKSVTSETSISAFLSPAVIYEDNKYKIWTVNYNENKIEYWESATGETWTKIRDIALTYSAFDETHRIWHIDVEKIDGVYVMVAMTRQSGTRHWPLYLSTSADNITWETPWVVIKYADTDKWDSRIYRSCIIKDNGVYRIYYSAYDTSNRYHMAISESSDLHHFCGRDIVY